MICFYCFSILITFKNMNYTNNSVKSEKQIIDWGAIIFGVVVICLCFCACKYIPKWSNSKTSPEI